MKSQLKKVKSKSVKSLIKRSRPYLKKRAWKAWSVFIRTKYADKFGYVVCYTCPTKKHFREMHAGHYKHGRLDFDERNIHPQCPQCNKWNHGRLDVYGERLTKELGVKGMAQLVLDANTKMYSKQELVDVIEKYETNNL